MCVANAFEGSGTELFLGFSMKKPGVIGGLRMVELVSEHAEVDHNYLSETSKRACSQAFRGHTHTYYHMTAINSPPKISQGNEAAENNLLGESPSK